jgi:hypothetical protein
MPVVPTSVSVDSDFQRLVDILVAYLANHSRRLDYRHRLACGEPVGSGLIGGACQLVIGKRMKQTGLRRTVAYVNRMAELRARPIPTGGPNPGSPQDLSESVGAPRSQSRLTPILESCEVRSATGVPRDHR